MEVRIQELFRQACSISARILLVFVLACLSGDGPLQHGDQADPPVAMEADGYDADPSFDGQVHDRPAGG
jgi:hypothetical protein